MADLGDLIDNAEDLVSLASYAETLLNLASYGSTILDFAKSPVYFIRKRLVSIIVGVVASIATTFGDFGRDILGRVADAFDKAADAVSGAINGAIDPVVSGWIGANRWVADSAVDVLGPAGSLVVIAFVIIQLALILRAIPPLLVALSDTLSAVPVVGSLLNGLVTFALGFFRR